MGGSMAGEEELRALLQGAVREMEPAPDALDQLRQAVVARRRRRRHAMVGAAAMLLLGGTSIPAMLHAAHAGSGADRPANAASSSDAQTSANGGMGENRLPPRGTWPPGTGGGAENRTAAPNDPDRAQDHDAGGAGNSSGGPGADPAATVDVSAPACLREQLGKGTGTLGAADAEGRVYGTLRMANTSASTCTVDGGGDVVAVAQGSADPERIQVVDHTAGDAASGLPDPDTAPDQLVLEPGEAYEVRFAWIPAEGGGTTGCAAPNSSPSPNASEAPGSGTPGVPSSDGAEEKSDGMAGPGDNAAEPDADVEVSHTPEAGEPADATTTLTDACAGTVYRTDALPAQ